MKEKIILGLIILLAFTLRIWQVDKVPPALYWDEVAIGYNAYTISQTGADEYGIHWPLVFRSFDDYKLPGMIYSVALAIKILGLNELAVRIPAVIYGTATVFVMFLILQSLWRKKYLSYLGAMLLAISPWHLQFSRPCFEAGGGLFFFLLAIFFLLKKKLLLALLMSLLCLYFYLAYWVLVPVFWIGISILYREKLFLLKRKIIYGILLTLVILAPLIITIERGAGWVRFMQVSLTSQENVVDAFNQSINRRGNDLPAKLFYNHRLILTKTVIEYYFSHFSPQFLFFDGDTNSGNERHRTLGMGTLYLWEIPLLIYGVIKLFFLKDKRKWIIYMLVIISPLAAALSYPAPHALRSLTMILPLTMLTTYGVYDLYMKHKKLLIMGLTPIIIFSFFNYLFLYYDHTPRFINREWAYGYKEAVQEVKILQPFYDKVLFTGHFWKPYIFYAFYNNIDPRLFQQKYNEKQIDNVKFTGTVWAKDEVELDSVDLIAENRRQKTLFVLSDKEIANLNKTHWLQKEINYKPNLKIIKTINDLRGQEMFYIFEIKN